MVLQAAEVIAPEAAGAFAGRTNARWEGEAHAEEGRRLWFGGKGGGAAAAAV